MAEFIVKAPAKINLFLHITGRRKDGYHELESLIDFCDLYDVIKINSSDSFSFTSETLGNDNLCIKAANYFSHKTGITLNCNISLEKNIPIAAGLGGGSSDAASVLQGLSKFYHRELECNMDEISYELGADVPIFLKEHSGLVKGIGECIEPIEIPKLNLLLINPMKECSTKDVFKSFTGDFYQNNFMKDFDISSLDNLITMLKKSDNQLLPPALKICPKIQNVLASISQQKKILFSNMTGSGATCFGIFENNVATKNAADSIKLKHPNWWIHSCTSL